MKLVVLLFVLKGLTCAESRNPIPNYYWEQREHLIEMEESLEVGSSIVLTPNEKKVNEWLMYLKLKELSNGTENPGDFLPAKHFFHTKNKIEKQPVFKFLRSMPKGALLHTHDLASVSLEFLHQLTFLPNLYLCRNEKRQRLKFFKQPKMDECDWQLVSTLRETQEDFDEWLLSKISLIREVPDFEHINHVWSTFQNILGMVAELITYKPVFVKHYLQTLKELDEDHISYVELRGTLPPVYDLDGRIYNEEEVIEIYENTTRMYQETNPSFYGAKFIYALMRLANSTVAMNYANLARTLLAKHGNFVAGFDFVGQEHLGRPLLQFAKILSYLEKGNFYFHAGETNWYGGKMDLNLFDAILLRTKRIGHGYSLIKHPELMKIVKYRNIALEISPISNQVLKLVQDMRNHPAANFLANGLPVVVTNDNPTFWGAKGVSYDWYMMFVGISRRHADLKLLKQLALNSIGLSALESRPRPSKKWNLFKTWSESWDTFINNLAKNGMHSFLDTYYEG